VKQEEDRITRLGKIINKGREISAKFPFDEKLNVLTWEGIDLKTRANHGTYKEYGNLINETCKSKNIPSPFAGEIDWTFRNIRDRVKTVNTLLWLLVQKTISDKAILEMKRTIGQLQEGQRKKDEELHLSNIKIVELEKKLASKDEQMKKMKQVFEMTSKETNVKAEVRNQWKGKELQKTKRRAHQRPWKNNYNQGPSSPRFYGNHRSRKSRGWSLCLDEVVKGKKWPNDCQQEMYDEREGSMEIKLEEDGEDSDSIVLVPAGDKGRKVCSSGKYTPPTLKPCSSDSSGKSTLLSVQEEYKKRLQAIAREHNPDAVEPISKLLESYPGREHEVYLKVCLELGLKPSPEYFGPVSDTEEEESSGAIGAVENSQEDASSDGLLVLSEANLKKTGLNISPRSDSTVIYWTSSKRSASIKSIPWLAEDLLDEQDLDVELSKTWSFAQKTPLKDPKDPLADEQFYDAPHAPTGIEYPKQLC